ncbi:efflux RND transporter periplasmic adaptor subunit [Aquabacterium sp. A7-Y]|uniref:efflux RND transporter periplasmic adaptor subunit n=1 Tax=Aquabacterium sp. A7-Y TaxID=1349605 RepID=UPI00223CD50F|nr:efflux RND transporter periplasmic adaptor subunit [Aquabacterium sp. A7-Y]MCW7539584.1 efflux RND transporter periplasmic adaptor subunit [Aquabacterium sp. A7-Y]
MSAILMSACGDKPQAEGHGGAPGGAMPAMPVSVRNVKLQAVPVTLEAVGQAEGSKEVEVRARVSGLIERQLYQEGERVKAGAALYQIERAPFEIALQQARANLGQQNAQLEQARREAQRLKPLAEQQAVSQREYDDAATSVRLAEAAVAQAQAQVREAELNLSYTAVTAPITGISGRSQKSQGSLVTPGSDSLLTSITQTDPIWVRFSFSEAEQSQLRGARKAEVRLLDAGGKPVAAQGKLNFAGSTVDPRIGTVQLRAEFPNPGLDVLPGQFVRAQVVAGEQQAFLVPRAAVMQTDQGTLVWTVRDGKAAPAPVEVAGWSGGDWVVRKGLKEGDQVILDNLMKLRPGAPVSPQAAGAAAPGAAASAAAPAASAPAASAAQ